MRVLPAPNCNKAFATMDSTLSAYKARRTLDGHMFQYEKTPDGKMQSYFKFSVKFVNTFSNENETKFRKTPIFKEEVEKLKKEVKA